MFLIDNIKRALFPFYKSEKIKKIFDVLNQNGQNNAMLVGGCVRKYILKQKIDEIDIATIFTPEELIEKFSKTNIKIKKTGIEHGTITLILENESFEITTLREDISTDGRHAKVSFTKDWKKDSDRRDFTINAIYLDSKGKILDPQMGLKDLKNKKVNFIGNPDLRIKEDYLRILRYLRFSLEYENFEPNDTNLKAIKLNLNGITKLSKERIYNELKKIIKLENFQNILRSSFLLHIFKLIFPEFKYIDRLKNLSNFKNINNIELDENFILSTMLIDLSDNHEYFSHKYNISNETKNCINLYSKLFANTASNKNFFTKDLNKNIFYFGKRKIKLILLIFSMTKEKVSLPKIKKTFKKIDSVSIPKFPITGDYLIKKGFKSGKKVGELLKKIEEQWIDNNFELDDGKLNDFLKKN